MGGEELEFIRRQYPDFSVPNDSHPASSFQKGTGKIRKVPPQFIHNLECLPHVGRIDSDRPLVLLIIPSLYWGLGAQLDAVNRKGVGREKEDHMLVNPFVHCHKSMHLPTHQGHLCQPVLLTTGPAGKECSESSIPERSSNEKCISLEEGNQVLAQPVPPNTCMRSLPSISPSSRGIGS